MASSPTTTSHHHIHPLLTWLGALPILVGGLVLLGWWLDLVPLTRIHPALVAMNPVTALAFILAGVALLLLRLDPIGHGRRRLAAGLSLAVALVGLLKLGDMLFGWGIDLDQMLFREKLSAAGSQVPNRMAPNTALSFFLLGAALLLVNRPPRRAPWLSQSMTLGAGVVALAALIGYAYGIDAFYGVGSFIPMALHTALTFLALAIGILCAQPNVGIMGVLTSDSLGGGLARRLLPAVLLIPVGLGWLRLLGQQAGLVDAAQGTWFLVTATIVALASLVSWQVHALYQTEAARKQVEAALRAAETRLRTVVTNAPIVFFAIDNQGVWTISEGRDLPALGRTPGAVVGRSIFEAYRDNPTLLANIRRALAGQEVTTIVELAGSVFDARYTPLRDEHGEVAGVIGVATDITERMQAERELRRSEASLATAQRIAHLGSWDWHIMTGALQWSDETYRIFGFTPQEYVPTYARFLTSTHPDDGSLVEAAIQATLEEGAPCDLTYRIIRPDGAVRTIHVQGELQRDTAGTPARMVGIIYDVTERKALESQLLRRAFHDPLTGLPNRALFMERLGHALERSDRQARACAVLYVDVDRFKAVNDSLGHATGDQLLIALSRRLTHCLRPEDTVARLGGDEFVILLEEVDEAKAVIRVAERIIAACRVPLSLAGHELVVAASVGIALSAPAYDEAEKLLRAADLAMYRAKARGGAGYEVGDLAIGDHVHERLTLEGELRRSIERGQLRVYYQPTVELATGRLAGMEALVRWEHPERGLISPAEFIPLAETTGLIHSLGRWVLTTACAQADRWRAAYPEGPPLRIAVNLSARQFQHAEIVDDVAAVLRQTGLAPRQLMLEITESVVMEEAEASRHTLTQLKDLGVQVAIDDFGTGYSSLSYLKRLPVDLLKVDRSFVDGLGQDPEDTVIVDAIVTLAQRLGLGVVAEGVETAEQVAALQALRCTWGQGYYFAKPLPAEQIDGLLRQADTAHGGVWPTLRDQPAGNQIVQ